MNNIKSERKRMGLTQKQLAHNLNDYLSKNNLPLRPITYASISRWEAEETEPKQKMWDALAAFFKVSAEYLQGFSEFKTSKEALANELISKGKHPATLEDIPFGDFTTSELASKFDAMYSEYDSPHYITDEHKADIYQSVNQLKQLYAILVATPSVESEVTQQKKDELLHEVGSKAKLSVHLITLIDKIFDTIVSASLVTNEQPDYDHERLAVEVDHINQVVTDAIKSVN